MVGSTIKVVATAESGNTFESDATEEVGVYEALEILSAEQTGSNTALLKFSAPVTTLDTITVKKGSVEKTIASQEFADTTFTSVTVTMKDNFANGTYTATITPADDDVAPSSVDFEAEAATKASEIEIVGDKLVMKDVNFKEGYFFVKGYNEFGEEIKLSGLTINAAPSDSYSFDVSTGKVTVTYKNPGYAVVKNLSVFAQYTDAKGNILVAQKTLEVSTLGYPAAIEWGDIEKDGDKRDDGLLTIAELGSNKYYVEIDSVTDQYENELSADDLNDLVTKEKLVTVIPSDVSPIYFATNATPFAEKNGKVIVPLAPGNGMPGPGSLMIAGAGGTFETPVEISDNPFIQTLTVDIPDIYEAEKTAEFTFSAVDQYGDELDLYDFAPTVKGDKLTFGDKNNLTGQSTTIQASDNGAWEIKKDTVKKTFTVKYTPTAAAKSVVSFTIITAGMETNVPTRPVNTKGTSAQIVAQSSAASIVAGKDSNIGSYVQFKDANGKVMDRIDDAARYPRFLYATTITTDDTIKDDAITAYRWVVTANKLDGSATNDLTTNFADRDGVIITGTPNAAGTLAVGTTFDAQGNAKDATANYYVTLLGANGAGKYKVLDSKAFRFIYVPASASEITYKVKQNTSSKLLYAHPDSTDSEKITLIATNEAGETWEVDGGFEVTADAPFTTSGNEIYGKIPAKIGSGNVSVKVYDPTGKALDTVSIPYSDADRVPSKVDSKLITTINKNDGTSPEGAQWKPGARLDLDTSANNATKVSFDGTKLTITNATYWDDTFEAVIKDQYDKELAGSDVEVNGTDLKTKNNYATAGDEVNVVMTSGSQKVDIMLYVKKALNTELVAGQKTSAIKVNDEGTLLAALETAKNQTGVNTTITLEKSVALSAGKTLNIATGDTLVIPANVQLTSNVGGNTYNISGTMEVNGYWTDNAADTINLSGTVTGSGHWTNNKQIKDSEGAVISLTGTSWEIAHAGAAFQTGTGVTVKNNVIITGNTGASLNLGGGTAENLTVTLAGTNNDATVVLPVSTTATIVSGKESYEVVTTATATATTITETASDAIKAQVTAGTGSASVTDSDGEKTEVNTTATTIVPVSYEEMALEIIGLDNNTTVNNEKTAVGNYYWGDGSQTTGKVEFSWNVAGWKLVTLSDPTISVDEENKKVTFNYTASGSLYQTWGGAGSKANGNKGYYTIGFMSKNKLDEVISSEAASITVGGIKYTTTDLDDGYLTNAGWYGYNKSTGAFTTPETLGTWTIVYSGATGTEFEGYTFIHNIDLSGVTIGTRENPNDKT